MASSLPPWAGSSVLDESTVERYRAMTVEERWSDFCELQALAEALLATHPARERALWLQEERDTEALQLWERLMEKKRRAARPR